MKSFIATLIATAAVAAIGIAPAAAQTNKDAYKTAMDKVKAEYKVSKDKCDAMSGHAEDICEDEAKLVRAKGELDAVTKFDNTGNNVHKARGNVIDAEYELAEEKCDALKGDAEDKCEMQAKSTRDAARDANKAK
jgi:hyperosmotically inducible protein